MKTEERRELQTNDLGKLTNRVRGSLEKYAEAYGNQVLIGICAVALVAAGTIYWTRTSTATQAAGWTQMSIARSAEDYANVADSERFRGTEVAGWARLREGELHLQTGLQLMFTDRTAAESDLRRAEDSFSEVLEQRSLPGRIRERALFGLGQAREALAGENVDPAIEAYSQLVREFPNSLYQRRAQRRIDILETGGARDFYAWFSRQEPPDEDDLGRPQDGISPGHPLFGEGADPAMPDFPGDPGSPPPRDAQPPPFPMPSGDQPGTGQSPLTDPDDLFGPGEGSPPAQQPPTPGQPDSQLPVFPTPESRPESEVPADPQPEQPEPPAETEPESTEPAAEEPQTEEAEAAETESDPAEPDAAPDES